MTLACLPILTAGAALGTAGAALDRLLTMGRWSTTAECWADFRARLRPGLWAGPLVLTAGWLIAVDVAALRRGSVPGGPALIAAVLLAAAVLAGFAALVAGLAGTSRSHPVRRAAALVATRPSTLAATTGVVLVATALAAFIHPAVVPVLAGFALFAVHVVLRRLPAPPAPLPAPRAHADLAALPGPRAQADLGALPAPRAHADLRLLPASPSAPAPEAHSH